MIFDFSVRDHVDFVKDGRSFDLHNEYEIDGINYFQADVSVRWRRLNGRETVHVRFSDVDVFQLMVRGDNAGRELGVLEYAGFIFQEEEFFNKSMIDFNEQAAGCCFLLGFEGGDVRIRSRRATLEFA